VCNVKKSTALLCIDHLNQVLIKILVKILPDSPDLFSKTRFWGIPKSKLSEKKIFAINAHWLNFWLVGHITFYDYILTITTM